MLLEVLKYGHPVLRQKGAPIESLTPEIKRLIADMLDTMHERHGVGLAAQQIGRALQLTVIDVREAKDRPSTLELRGRTVPVEEFMPLVLINPQITPHGQTVVVGEGCLSFPEIFGEIARLELVDVHALDIKFKPMEFCAGGLLSRAIQHEVDHLNGVLFIDRMNRNTREELRGALETLQTATKEQMKGQ